MNLNIRLLSSSFVNTLFLIDSFLNNKSILSFMLYKFKKLIILMESNIFNTLYKLNNLVNSISRIDFTIST